MTYRTATVADIPGIFIVGFAVKENRLSDPSKVTEADCLDMIERRGCGWVCEADHQIVGFSFVDLQEKNVWALFILPEYENRGIGRKLHDLMLEWAFVRGVDSLWLSTVPGTRAEGFYQKMGWQKTGLTGSGEIRFEAVPGQKGFFQ